MKLFLMLGFAVALLAVGTGCSSFLQNLAIGAAEDQPRRAMETGRMSPGEFQQQRDEIRQALGRPR